MAIFNSLGSNYDAVDVWLSLKQLLWPNRQLKLKLKQQLEDKFEGEARLLFSGRDAIEYLLTAYELKEGDEVLTQAFSCSSVEEAIVRVGAQPVYFDLGPNQLPTKLEQIQKSYQSAENPKLVILQHTLGYVDDVPEIKSFCEEKNLILVEDLAQSAGALDKNREPAGTHADAVILSFGRDKILDGISGGAAIFKTKPHKFPKIPDWFELSHDLSNKKQVTRLLFFPFFSQIIRMTYDLGIGKGLHWACKKTKLIWTPIKSLHKSYQSYPAYFAPLVLRRLDELDVQLQHRRKIAHYYYNRLTDVNAIKIPVAQKDISYGANLRFPILMHNLQHLKKLVQYLQQNQVFIADRWYKHPVDSGSVEFDSRYQSNSCPLAEKYSRTLLNLPTHKDIQINEAEKIVSLIINWIDSHYDAD